MEVWSRVSVGGIGSQEVKVDGGNWQPVRARADLTYTSRSLSARGFLMDSSLEHILTLARVPTFNVQAHHLIAVG